MSPESKAALLRTDFLLAQQECGRQADTTRLSATLSEYEELARTLTTLPERVERPMLVPFGKLAKFEGSLQHTNEVMCLLGDNYFALRSASQARSALVPSRPLRPLMLSPPTQAAEIALRRAEFAREQLRVAEGEVT